MCRCKIQISNWPEMKVKAKCARALIRYLKAKESERENSNELCTTKLYNATCRQHVCGQNKDNLCLQAARTLIWRSCAFYRGPMTMPVLDGVKPMAITLPICGTSESFVEYQGPNNWQIKIRSKHGWNMRSRTREAEFHKTTAESHKSDPQPAWIHPDQVSRTKAKIPGFTKPVKSS